MINSKVIQIVTTNIGKDEVFCKEDVERDLPNQSQAKIQRSQKISFPTSAYFKRG